MEICTKCKQYDESEWSRSYEGNWVFKQENLNKENRDNTAVGDKLRGVKGISVLSQALIEP